MQEEDFRIGFVILADGFNKLDLSDAKQRIQAHETLSDFICLWKLSDKSAEDGELWTLALTLYKGYLERHSCLTRVVDQAALLVTEIKSEVARTISSSNALFSSAAREALLGALSDSGRLCSPENQKEADPFELAVRRNALLLSREFSALKLGEPYAQKARDAVAKGYGIESELGLLGKIETVADNAAEAAFECAMRGLFKSPLSADRSEEFDSALSETFGKIGAAALSEKTLRKLSRKAAQLALQYAGFADEQAFDRFVRNLGRCGDKLRVAVQGEIDSILSAEILIALAQTAPAGLKNFKKLSAGKVDEILDAELKSCPWLVFVNPLCAEKLDAGLFEDPFETVLQAFDAQARPYLGKAVLPSCVALIRQCMASGSVGPSQADAYKTALEKLMNIGRGEWVEVLEREFSELSKGNPGEELPARDVECGWHPFERISRYLNDPGSFVPPLADRARMEKTIEQALGKAVSFKCRSELEKALGDPLAEAAKRKGAAL